MTESERIRKILLDAVDDFENTPIEQMRVQLLAAGWIPQTQTFWRHPNGSLHLGPYVAWKKMRAELLKDGGE